MLKQVRLLSVFVFVLALGASTVLANGNRSATRVNGTITLTLFGGPGCDSPTGLCSTGSTSGDLVGDVFSEVTEFTEGRVFNRVRANTTITTAEGQLITKLSGRVAVADGASNTRLRIVGGTGIYEGARGLIRNEGTLDPATGVETVIYTGTVVVPGN
ncbi:MAG: hypothetical protein AAFU54_25760 [Chloroflexota bacterium]